MTDIKEIIILSGPIGAGKTTVSRELLKLLPAPAVYIEGDTFWKHIAKTTEDYDGRTNYKMLMSAMLGAAIPYATNGYTVLLDLAITPRFVKGAMEKMKNRGITLKYVVIRPDLEICAQRAATRTNWVIKDYEGPAYNLYQLFNETDDYVIDNHTGDAAAIAARICAGLNEGKFVVTM